LPSNVRSRPEPWLKGVYPADKRQISRPIPLAYLAIPEATCQLAKHRRRGTWARRSIPFRLWRHHEWLLHCPRSNVAEPGWSVVYRPAVQPQKANVHRWVRWLSDARMTFEFVQGGGKAGVPGVTGA